MEVDTRNLALTKALTEIKNVSPEISEAFLFQRKNGILVRDESTDKEEANVMVEAFESLQEKADAISGIESVTFHGTGGRLGITQAKDYYLATITSKETDEKTVNNLTRVLAPTILKIVQEIYPSTQHSFEKTAETEKETSGYIGKQLPDLPFVEFVVDDISRFGVLSGSLDTVYIDVVTIGQWTELYGENTIKEVIVEESFTGKSVQCKFEPITNSKYEKKGSIQIPEKIQQVLRTRKGAKVLVKPVIQAENSQASAEEAITYVELETPSNLELFLPDSPISQLIVENLSRFRRLRGGPEMVRFESALTERWKDFYGDKTIEEVIIEDTKRGKKVRSKFKITTNLKFEGKGIIQMPESLQEKLEVKKGSLVLVKPVVE
jgi:hypothetical protein